jgi:preprotein translocase subunit SecA
LLVHQALVAQNLFHKDKDYLVKDGKIQIIDEYTGRLMSDRSWEKGLHQMIESKEGCEVTPQNDILARISYQRFFRHYHWLSGMTGTANEVSKELWAVYNLQVRSISTNNKLSRRKMPSKMFVSEKEKFDQIIGRIKKLNRSGRPVLVGTPSVAVSERLSGLLEEEKLLHRVLNARHDKDEAEIIAEAGQRKHITVATNMAGRGTDILLEPDVVDIGGLHVIASEPHSARRIDRQLYGRSGRQGDPGSYEGFSSLEDDVLAHYAHGLISLIMRKTIQYNLPWKAPLSRCFIWFAQKSLEKRHYAVRKELLQFDTSQESTLAFSGKGE